MSSDEQETKVTAATGSAPGTPQRDEARESDTWSSDDEVHKLPLERKQKFGEVVWAKQTGFPAWPAVIWDPRYLTAKLHSQASKFLHKGDVVWFYGADGAFAFVPFKDISPYAENRDAMVQRKLPPKHLAAIQSATADADEDAAKSKADRLAWIHTSNPRCSLRKGRRKKSLPTATTTAASKKRRSSAASSSSSGRSTAKQQAAAALSADAPSDESSADDAAAKRKESSYVYLEDDGGGAASDGGSSRSEASAASAEEGDADDEEIDAGKTKKARKRSGENSKKPRSSSSAATAARQPRKKRAKIVISDDDDEDEDDVAADAAGDATAATASVKEQAGAKKARALQAIREFAEENLPLKEYRAAAQAMTVLASGKPLKKRRAAGGADGEAGSKKQRRKDGDKSEVRRSTSKKSALEEQERHKRRLEDMKKNSDVPIWQQARAQDAGSGSDAGPRKVAKTSAKSTLGSSRAAAAPATAVAAAVASEAEMARATKLASQLAASVQPETADPSVALSRLAKLSALGTTVHASVLYDLVIKSGALSAVIAAKESGLPEVTPTAKLLRKQWKSTIEQHSAAVEAASAMAKAAGLAKPSTHSSSSLSTGELRSDAKPSSNGASAAAAAKQQKDGATGSSAATAAAAPAAAAVPKKSGSHRLGQVFEGLKADVAAAAAAEAEAAAAKAKLNKPPPPPSPRESDSTAAAAAGGSKAGTSSSSTAATAAAPAWPPADVKDPARRRALEMLATVLSAGQANVAKARKLAEAIESEIDKHSEYSSSSSRNGSSSSDAAAAAATATPAAAESADATAAAAAAAAAAAYRKAVRRAVYLMDADAAGLLGKKLRDKVFGGLLLPSELVQKSREALKITASL